MWRGLYTSAQTACCTGGAWEGGQPPRRSCTAQPPRCTGVTRLLRFGILDSEAESLGHRTAGALLRSGPTFSGAAWVMGGVARGLEGAAERFTAPDRIRQSRLFRKEIPHPLTSVAHTAHTADTSVDSGCGIHDNNQQFDRERLTVYWWHSAVS